MKQSQFVTAYQALQRLSNQTLPLAIAYGLHKLKKAIQVQWDFQLEQEKKFLLDYEGISDEYGTVRFPDDPPVGLEADETNEYGKKRADFNRAMNELADLEVSADFKPVTLDASNLRMNVSLNDLVALEGFVDFTGIE